MKIPAQYVKLVTALVAVALAVAGVYLPEYATTLNTVVGILFGKEFLLGSNHVKVEP